jgi:hypothetical protein
MSQFFPETAHKNTDIKKYHEGLDRIFGQKASPFCDKCEKRHSYCECENSVISNLTSKIHPDSNLMDGTESKSTTI